MKLGNMNVSIKGTVPLLMHSAQLSNPRNEFTIELKKVTSKRKKSDQDLSMMASIEFLGGLYLDDSEALEAEYNHAEGSILVTNNPNIVMPGHVLSAMIVEGAKKSKLGRTFKAGVFVDGDGSFGYAEKKANHSLGAMISDERLFGFFSDLRSVKVGTSRVMRTRPIFRDWTVDFSVSYNPEIVNGDQIAEAIDVAGSMVGLCDNRPQNGRFEVASIS